MEGRVKCTFDSEHSQISVFQDLSSGNVHYDTVLFFLTKGNIESLSYFSHRNVSFPEVYAITAL